MRQYRGDNFNRKIEKMLRIYPHVITMDNELVRKHFSTHGLHMNFKGKLEITHKFATQIIDVATRKKEKKPIYHAVEPRSRHQAVHW
jgi:hypothetical protein